MGFGLEGMKGSVASLLDTNFHGLVNDLITRMDSNGPSTRDKTNSGLQLSSTHVKF